MYYTDKIKKPLYTNVDNNIKLSYLNDFLFFISILKNYIQYNQTNLLYILNKFIIKYILYIKYISWHTNNYNIYISFYNLLLYNLFSFKSNTIVKYNDIKNINQKIVLIKRVSRTRKKGRVRRYKVLLFIGNKSGWIGFGSSKDYYLQDAILKARKKAFNNIYYIPASYFNSFKSSNTILDKKNKKIYIDINTKNILKVPRSFIIRSFFECLGVYNINSKKIGSLNIYNTINYILKSFSK